VHLDGSSINKLSPPEPLTPPPLPSDFQFSRFPANDLTNPQSLAILSRVCSHCASTIGPDLVGKCHSKSSPTVPFRLLRKLPGVDQQFPFWDLPLDILHHPRSFFSCTYELPPLFLIKKQTLYFHAFTNCPFRKSFLLTFMHRMASVPPPSLPTFKRADVQIVIRTPIPSVSRVSEHGSRNTAHVLRGRPPLPRVTSHKSVTLMPCPPRIMSAPNQGDASQ